VKLSVFGLGYVGAVSAACLASRGHRVVGVDISQIKVDMVNSGKSPIIEAELTKLLETMVDRGALRATTDAEEAVAASELSLICVATPSLSNGNLDFRYLEAVCGQIGTAIRKKRQFHVVAVRSTSLPGTAHDRLLPILERESGGVAGEDFGVCTNPEFLREGSAVRDFNNPSRTIIGEIEARSGDLVQQIYKGLPGPVIRCPIEVAEMVKYADNAWHALKVSFANEIGGICKTIGVDSHAVMNVFCEDTKLNLSSRYLMPGFAFGGSCLPKDLRALTYKAHSNDLQIPLLSSIMPSNQAQIEHGIEMVLATGKRSVGVLGLSFKAGTDDLRGSPLVELIERLIGKGIDVRVYDSSVNLARLVGANREYILRVIPHIERLMVNTIDDVLAHAEVIVIGNAAPEFAGLAGRLKQSQHVIDLVRVKEIELNHDNYEGVCW
jgi:GDP-mannose 6-dehydrogenase